jgi:hypothetical protein
LLRIDLFGIYAIAFDYSKVVLYSKRYVDELTDVIDWGSKLSHKKMSILDEEN